MSVSCLMVFGGAFDPVHLGHIQAIQQLLRSVEEGEVHLLPCYRHPTKQVVASNHHRLAMLQMLEKPPRIVIDKRELECDEVSYTVDTLQAIRQQVGPERSLAFVLGQDAFATIDTWKNYLDILKLAHLIALVRPGWEAIDFADHPVVQHCQGWSNLECINHQASGQLFCLDNTAVDVSSSQIRDLIAHGQPPRYLMPASIWQYIRHQQLYQAPL